MSLFTKVLILFIIFLISFFSMIFVFNQTNKLTQTTIETILKHRYMHISEDLLTYIINDDKVGLDKKLSELNFKIIEDKEHYTLESIVICEKNIKSFNIKVLKHEDDKYILYMKYIDDDIFLIDMKQDKHFYEKTFLNNIILINIAILLVLFIIILRMLYPLKVMSKCLKRFGDGQYCVRIKNDYKAEMGEVVKTFNFMAENIEGLITSRQRLLRDIGHELKTPIAKSKIALEMIDNSKYKKILKKALYQIDEMSSELLYIEKINSNQSKMDMETFNVETLINESLSKLFIEDETSVEIQIDTNFDIEADLNYLAIALKNLVDNALKYRSKLPILIVVENKVLSVKSRGDKLEKPLEFLCEAFTQDDNSRSQAGYGLGLNLVKRILNKHNFEFLYKYENGYNIFMMNLS